MIFELPTTLEFCGRDWAINTDYRDVLRTLAAFGDPDLSEAEKTFICLSNLYPDFAGIPRGQLQPAYDAAIDFIDQRCEASLRGPEPPLKIMDWVQDAPLIFPAVNRSAGFEVRSAPYLHWWTFVGYFMEIRDSVFATVLALRQKKYGRPRKKLEKQEQAFWNSNRAICELRPRRSREDREARRRLEALLAGEEKTDSAFYNKDGTRQKVVKQT